MKHTCTNPIQPDTARCADCGKFMSFTPKADMHRWYTAGYSVMALVVGLILGYGVCQL